MATSAQFASAVLMIRPAAFGFNPETAESNAFQKTNSESCCQSIRDQAVVEFDAAIQTLRGRGVTVLVEDDTPEPKKPDAVFPNNWISTHEDGTVITYPMFSFSRRHEVRDTIIESMGRQFQINRHWRMEAAASKGEFLEGTGSMVLDRANRIAYACHSPRTSEGLLHEFCNRLGYSPVLFTAVDQNQSPIYHTNVMMSVLQDQVVVCLESIVNPTERETVAEAVESCGHSIITVTQSQLEKFACNLLQVGRQEQKPVIVLSTTALEALSESQRKKLSRDSEMVPLSIPVIEHFGGGSVRCMLAEIFLPPL